jgi:hypothetical protein
MMLVLRGDEDERGSCFNNVALAVRAAQHAGA